MDGIHDAGGMNGYGPVEYQQSEPFFHYQWEGRVLSLLTWLHLKGISWHDKSRFFREMMGNENYVDQIRDSYYTHWLSAIERILVSEKIISEEERERRVREILDGRYEERNPVAHFDAAEIDEAITKLTEARSLTVPGPAAVFGVGDRVRVKNMNPPGHTRCPKYLRNHIGDIITSHGAQVYPDTSFAGHRDDVRPLYTVKFSAAELWGDDAKEGEVIFADLWEPYLTAV